MGKYFGTDGVRGLANVELTPELAFNLGRVGAYVLSQKFEGDGKAQIMVARDTRISGSMLEKALTAGITSVGVDAMLLGVLPTPGLAYMTRIQSAAGGIMISASHNPAHDNGIKFFGPDGYKLSDDLEKEIESYLDREDDLPRPSAEGLGVSDTFKAASQKYSQLLTQSISGDLEGLHVVLDAANGAASPMLNSVFADLNADFTVIHDSPDGLNINVNSGSTHPELLAEKVKELGADAGLAFDGDADRCIAVDADGQIIDGDQILFICGKYLDESERLKQDTVVTTVMSNIGLYKAFEENGIQTVTTQVGDRYVMETIRKEGYNFGGEQSGHIIFEDIQTTGDGILTGIQLLNVMKETGRSLADLASEMKLYPQKLINVRVTDKKAAQADDQVQEKIQEVSDRLGTEGRVLVRPSGTEPLLRIMVEGPDDETVNAYCQEIAQVVESKFGLEK